MTDQIQTRRGTVAEWTADDPILALGEFGIVVDSAGGPTLYFGDGASLWSALSPISAPDRMRWAGEWVSGTPYQDNDVVRDGLWTMVCEGPGDVTERPAPQIIGDPTFVYNGQLVETTSSPTTVLIHGQRYKFSVNEALVGYRLYTFTGLRYQVFVQDVDTGVLSYVLSYVATLAGWVEFSLVPILLPAGKVVDIGVMVTDPAASVSSFVGPWNYKKPSNPSAPGAGEVQHANNALDRLAVHKEDNTTTDRSADLATIILGDIIETQGIRWFVQAINDQGTWIDFTIQPAAQAKSTGVQTFEFFTSSGAPIPFGVDVDEWLGNADVRGLFTVTGFQQLAEDDNQYGVDLKIAQVSSATNWAAIAGAFASPIQPNP